jgi:glutamate synthase (ferredoxin)
MEIPSQPLFCSLNYCDVGAAWSTHHFACLVGFGASAVIPYAAYDAVLNWHSQKRNQLAIERGESSIS